MLFVLRRPGLPTGCWLCGNFGQALVGTFRTAQPRENQICRILWTSCQNHGYVSVIR